MRHLSLASFALAACASCAGAAALESAPVVPIGAASAHEPTQTPALRDDPWTGFSSFVLDAAHAAIAAADGHPHDARWDCQGAANDIRATSPDEGKKLRAKGNPEFLIAVLGEIALRAELDPGAAPTPPAESSTDSGESDDDDESVKRAKSERWLSVSASAAVFGDGKVRWLAVRGYGSGSAGDDDPEAAKHMRLKALPLPIRGALAEVVASLSSPSCSLAFLTAADLAPLPLSDTVRREASESLPREAERLKKVCALAARANGAWDVALSRLQVAFSVKDEVAQLRADLRVESGRVCLGRVEAVLKE